MADAEDRNILSEVALCVPGERSTYLLGDTHSFTLPATVLWRLQVRIHLEQHQCAPDAQQGCTLSACLPRGTAEKISEGLEQKQSQTGLVFRSIKCIGIT